MLFSELYKIKMNNVTFVGFRGNRPPPLAQSYPHKHTNGTTPLKRTSIPDTITLCVTHKNSHFIETEQCYLCRVLHFNHHDLMLINPPSDWDTANGIY